MNRIKCPNCGSCNTISTGACASDGLDYWQHIHCFNCKHECYAKVDLEATSLQDQIDTLADIIDMVRNLDIRTDEEIKTLDSTLDILLDMQKVSMETREE